MTILEYSKVILEKVSFDTQLFQKEFAKALKQLVEPEARDLTRWVERNFGQKALLPALQRIPQSNQGPDVIRH